jgi:branched-chain amino acid transport system ATP-binding protein
LATQPLLRAESLDVRYGSHRALRDVSIAVPAASIVAILGANGAGKSTTAKSLAGMVPMTGGRVEFEGNDVTGRAADELVKRGISLAPEGRHVFARLSVEENLLVGAYTSAKQRIRGRIDEVLTHFPVLREKLHERSGGLSGGQQQMLAIARALMSHPKLLILDEPTMGLAPIIVERLGETLNGIVREEGIGVLLIDQRLSLVEQTASQVYLLARGVSRPFEGSDLASHTLEQLYLEAETMAEAATGAAG